MLKFDNKEYRNLQEQVLQNQIDIEDLQEKANLGDLGIHIITPEPFVSKEQLPLPYDGEYGDGFLVGTTQPYTLYLWTRENNEYGGEWFDWGLLNAPSVIPGPRGEQGPKGDQGVRGSIWASQSGAPIQIAGYNNYDQALNTTNGDVFQFVNGVWQKVGNIRGPQGNQGVQGPQGSQGPQGPQGNQGPQGIQGQFITIVGTLDTINLLPPPDTVGRETAYLIPVDGAEHVYLIIGEGTPASPLVWHDAGSFSQGSGTKILLDGVEQEQINGTNIMIDPPTYTNHALTTVSVYSQSVGFNSLRANWTQLGSSVPVAYKSISLPICQGEEITTYAGTDRKGLYFKLTDTYKQSVTNQINAATPQSVQITAPTTATQGTITEADLATLNGSPINYITFNSEIYLAQDRQHSLGYLTYTHVGYDTSISNYIVKCITINVNNLSWVLTSNKLPVFTLTGTTLRITG